MPPESNLAAPQRLPDSVVVEARPAASDPALMAVKAGLYVRLKGTLDFALALALLVPAAPFIALGALLIKLTSRGPVIYSQVRLGRHGVPYTIYKLRTMAHNCEKHSGAQWSTVGDPRITLVGRFLRKTHLDELPQLWNVLKGDMSLVGPRPERPEFIPQLQKTIPRYRERLRARPGVTGLAQVQLPPDTDLASVRRKIAYDLYYAERLGFGLDVRVLLATALKVAGVPFGLLRRVCFLPTGEAVEKNFRLSQAEALPPPPQTSYVTEMA